MALEIPQKDMQGNPYPDKINTGTFNCNNYSNRFLEVPREVVDSLHPDNFESKPTRKSVLAKHKY